MAGFGNWQAVADHVGTKSQDECKVIPWQHHLCLETSYALVHSANVWICQPQGGAARRPVSRTGHKLSQIICRR